MDEKTARKMYPSMMASRQEGIQDVKPRGGDDAYPMMRSQQELERQDAEQERPGLEQWRTEGEAMRKEMAERSARAKSVYWSTPSRGGDSD